MSEKQLAALSKELGGKSLPDLAALSPAEIESLTQSLRRARRTQQEQLLRGPVRKILLP